MKIIAVALSLLLASGSWAAGPAGFGAIKIGMTKEALEGLPDSEGVRLTGPLTPLEYASEKFTISGVNKFKGTVVSSSIGDVWEAEFDFKDNSLASFVVAMNGEAALNRIKNQVEDKYGAPNVVDSTKEEQCIYRNGANFKIKWGNVSSRWVDESVSPNIETVLSVNIINVCPSNLRYGSTGAKNFYSLRMGRAVDQQQKKKEENLF